MAEKKNQTKSHSTKKNSPKSTSKKSGKTVDHESKKLQGMIIMLLGLVFGIWSLVIVMPLVTTGDTVTQSLTAVISGILNIFIALLIVYSGLLVFTQKQSKFSGWQVMGWLFFCFGILAMLHIKYFAGDIKTPFFLALDGKGGGIAGFVLASLIVVIPSIQVQYVVLSAIAILGIMLGTDFKIFGAIAKLFSFAQSGDAETKQAKKEEKSKLKAEKKALKEQNKIAAEKSKETETASVRELQEPAIAFPQLPNFVNGEKAAQNEQFVEPPIITDYSGKAFEEITDFNTVTVGDLLDDLDQYNDPKFVKNLMPRVSNKNQSQFVNESELEQFADENVKHDLIDNTSKEPEQTALEEVQDIFDDGALETANNLAETEPDSQSEEVGQPKAEEPKKVAASITSKPSNNYKYTLPPLGLLKGGINVKNPRMNQQIMDNSVALEETLASFGVKAKVVEVVCGPSIIRYELQPGPGVKVSKIVNLTDDIALALAAKGLRIEAPVPGKSVVGIEIAKGEVNPVFFKDVLATDAFVKSKSKLSIAFGIDINGNAVIGDLAEMPHLLIAGATGSGKSVCMNTLICSILYKATPEEVKIIMIDPKKVELASYNGLPHLGRPVVTDPKKAAATLREVVNEMERRYTMFANLGVKNFTSFNQLPDVELMPQIVVLIDELADLMMVASHDVEDAICRLAQMARAAGIHLVIATQRPSVDVITGLIKANVPSRIAFAVSSQIDSRTILDMGGAEKLLGKGDMLYFPIGNHKPVRVQGAFLSEAEIHKLVDYCGKQAKQEFIELPKDSETGKQTDKDSMEQEDDLFIDACLLVISAGQVSASSLQRRFRIGYNRAARLVETMEEKGIISKPEGNKRTVLMNQEAFEELYINPQEENDDI